MMQRVIQIIGLMDSFRSKNSTIKGYQEKLFQYWEQEAEILIDMGAEYLDNEQSEEALNHFQEALNTYKKMEYPEGEAFTHDLIGDIYLNDRNTTKALQHYQKAYEIYSSIDSPLEEEMGEKIEEVKQIHEDLKNSSEPGLVDEENQYEEDNSSSISENNLDHLKSDFESKPSKPKEKSVPATMEKIADKLETAIMILDNSSMYEMYYKEANSIEYLQEALNNADVIEDWEGQGTLHLMLGDSQLKLKKVDDALNHFEKAYDIFEDQNSKLGEAVSLLLIGTIYFIQNKKTNMYELFRNSMELFQELGYKEGEKVVISLLELLSN
jgi:tetratricopeptide (TPR) repeat protein